MVLGRGLYSCLFFEMYSAYAALGLLVLMYLQCSLYLVFRYHLSVLYTPFQKYIPHFSGSFSMWFRSFISCDIVWVGLNAICFGMSLNKQLSPYKHGQ